MSDGSHPITPLRVVFVSAEASRVAQVGGLADATAGLVNKLRRLGVNVHLIVPEYGGVELDDEIREPLPMPTGSGPAFARHGHRRGLGAVTLISAPGIARSHPYLDPRTGFGWTDNNERFLGFCAAAAALIELDPPDIVHLNDWHSAPIISWLEPSLCTVLTIHNLAHQGVMPAALAHLFGPRREAFERHGELNALAGAIVLADLVVTVSPSYADEITRPRGGNGLEDLLQARGDTLVGIRNGVEPDEWRPDLDLRLPASFDGTDLVGKRACRRMLLERAGLGPVDNRPVIGMVARLTEQKGVDIALALTSQVEAFGARLVLVGDGEPTLWRHAEATQRQYATTMRALPFEDRTAHLVVAGSDLLLMPSRFEPCGLPQMQAMLSGTIPVVTGVGGLRDTVIDADLTPATGTGFVARDPTVASVGDALERARRAWADRPRRTAIQQRGMALDWSWQQPAEAMIRCYQGALGRQFEDPTDKPSDVIDLTRLPAPARGDCQGSRNDIHFPSRPMSR